MQTTQPASFIDEPRIRSLIRLNQNPDPATAHAVIDKSLAKNGLDLHEVAILLNADYPEITARLFETARRVKQEIYGRRLVLFAPLYIANVCANNCLYCGFRKDNLGMKRRVLSMDEIRTETERMERQGHKRILMLTGEDADSSGIDYLLQAIETVYATRTADGKEEIRRINVEVAPFSVEDFVRLKAANIGTYILFQETYHAETYRAVHPSGPKSDYLWRLYAMDRAQQAGIDDVGIGVLFGLYDYKFEVLSLLMHAQHLEQVCGVGPHTISVPRIEPAMNAPLTHDVPHSVSDHDFKRLIAILRLAVPYTGIILTTREKAGLRDEIFELGVSQISAGSRTNPGGYGEKDSQPDDEQQFSLGDTRSLDEIVRAVCEHGYLPSFCTACYRQGRTGADFMHLAKPGLIHTFCLPNGLLTFKEYLLDYASAETRVIGERLIQQQLLNIADPVERQRTMDRLSDMQAGRRDLYL